MNQASNAANQTRAAWLFRKNYAPTVFNLIGAHYLRNKAALSQRDHSPSIAGRVTGAVINAGVETLKDYGRLFSKGFTLKRLVSAPVYIGLSTLPLLPEGFSRRFVRNIDSSIVFPGEESGLSPSLMFKIARMEYAENRKQLANQRTPLEGKIPQMAVKAVSMEPKTSGEAINLSHVRPSFGQKFSGAYLNFKARSAMRANAARERAISLRNKFRAPLQSPRRVTL